MFSNIFLIFTGSEIFGEVINNNADEGQALEEHVAADEEEEEEGNANCDMVDILFLFNK